jgi:hypothetical protein
MDYRKSEVITFVVEFFLISLRWRFQSEGQGKKHTFQCQLYPFFKHIWMDNMQIFTESKIIQWQNIIYIVETGIKGVG